MSDDLAIPRPRSGRAHHIELPPRSSRAKPSKLDLVAFHEAGHAVARVVLKRGVRSATIRPGDGNLGHVVRFPFGEDFMPDVDMRPGDRSLIKREVMAAYSGMVAEAFVTGRWNYAGADSDIHGANNLLSYLVTSDDEIEPLGRVLWIRARNLLCEPMHRAYVEAVADALLTHETLSGPAIRKVVSDTLGRIREEDEREVAKIPVHFVEREPGPRDPSAWV